MKLFRSLFLTLVLAGFIFSPANAQSPKTTYSETILITDYYLPCFDEIVTGEIYHEVMLVNSQFLGKIWGTLVGTSTGNEYTVFQILVDNLNLYRENGTAIRTSPFNLKFRLDGKLVFLLHGVFHVTVNANDDFVVVFDKYVVDCK